MLQDKHTHTHTRETPSLSKETIKKKKHLGGMLQDELAAKLLGLFVRRDTNIGA